MSELTKEWLQQTITELEEERDATPGAVNEYAAKALAAMKMALGALEAEPVAFIGQRMLEELTDGARSCGRVWPEVTDKLSDENRIPLYTSPPAPVSVPDGYRLQPISEYDAMCAAMLQGYAGNSPVIPDGVCPCCGRKPLKNRTCSVSGCDGKHVARGFCIKHYAIERKKDPSRRESIRAADKRYRARKAAIPQQEVKL